MAYYTVEYNANGGNWLPYAELPEEMYQPGETVIIDADTSELEQSPSQVFLYWNLYINEFNPEEEPIETKLLDSFIMPEGDAILVAVWGNVQTIAEEIVAVLGSEVVPNNEMYLRCRDIYAGLGYDILNYDYVYSLLENTLPDLIATDTKYNVTSNIVSNIWVGSKEEYVSLNIHDKNTLYYVFSDNIYLGDRGVIRIDNDNNRYVEISALETSVVLLDKKSEDTILYSTDNINWTNVNNLSQTWNLNSGDSIYLKGIINENNPDNPDSYTHFTITGKVNISGNINALINYTEENLNSDFILPNYCCLSMFADSTGINDTSNLLLPSTTLSEGCYVDMFAGCTSLINTPNLPATTLEYLCYEAMFDGCTSLTAAPELPATTLAEGCYTQMFRGCTSLTTAPELPVASLIDGCYEEMFDGCTSLTYIKCLATDISATFSTFRWVRNVSPTGTFVKDTSMTDWTTGESGTPSGWTVIDDLYSRQ